MSNKDILNHAGNYGIELWQVAETIGMNESAFPRKLHKELPQAGKEKLAKEGI